MPPSSATSPWGSFQTGKTIHLDDVARVEEDSLEERTQQSFINGREGAIIVIQKQAVPTPSRSPRQGKGR